MDEEPGEIVTEDEEAKETPGEFGNTEEDEEEEVEPEGRQDLLEEDINVTDSQVMIQLKEAEEEAEALRKEIAALKAEIDDYQCRKALTQEDEEHLQEIQLLLMEKIALLDELTKRIAKLMEFAGRGSKGEETTILDEDEEEGFPDDLLPRVVICSSWDDMMPKVVVCMDMKKPGANKKAEGDRDENGLTPEQREALEQERRCMAEERHRLQYQIACMEGEMRVMMRENDLLSKKVAQLKAEMDNQPPFEFEMSVSATQPPGAGCPKSGNMDMGYGVMGPNANNMYTMGAALSPGAEVQGRLAVSGPSPQFPPSGPACGGNPAAPPRPANCPPSGNGNQGNGHLPCGGMYGIPGKSNPCPKLQPQDANPQPAANDWTAMLPPYGKKCRKDFNAAQSSGCDGCGGCGGGCGGGGGGGCGGGGGGGGGCCGGGGNVQGPPMSFPGMNDQSLLPPGFLKQPPMDVNFKVNVQPQAGPCNKGASMDADARSNKIAQQLQEIEMELRRMQRDLCKAKKDKDTLKAQQATLNCAKNYIM